MLNSALFAIAWNPHIQSIADSIPPLRYVALCIFLAIPLAGTVFIGRLFGPYANNSRGKRIFIISLALLYYPIMLWEGFWWGLVVPSYLYREIHMDL